MLALLICVIHLLSSARSKPHYTETYGSITAGITGGAGLKKQFVSSLLGLLFGLLLSLQPGCSVYPLAYVVVNSEKLEHRPGIHLLDPNNTPYSIKVIKRKDGTTDYFWDIDSTIEQPKACRIKYHTLYSTNRFMVVEGRLGDGKKKYPVVLDTGASQSVFVKDTHILENNLAIYPMHTSKPNGYSLGTCHLPELHLGSIKLVDWPCLYLHRPIKPKMLGLSFAKDDSIIVGLPLLREFKYILFDSINKEVEFSHEELFEPQQPQFWEQYQFSIEEDFHGNAFLFVEIPIGSEKIELQLDTGSGNGLAIREELWENLPEKIRSVKLKKGKELYPYIGRLKCRRGIIEELQFSNRTIKKTRISVFPNDSPLLEECQGMIGMDCFRDTVIVLDFENEIMWVKNTQS